MLTPEWSLIFALTTFDITYIASRVGRHSAVHMFLADLAIAAEALTALAALVWMLGGTIAKDVALIGIMVTVACFVAVALTDSWWKRVLERVRRVLP